MSDIRSFLEAHLDAIPGDAEKAEKLREALDLALGQSKTVWRLIECKHCGKSKKYEVDFPNPAAIARAIKDLVELTKGKVPEQVNVSVKWEGLPVAELPTEELQRIAAREVVDDAEWSEVPALPAATSAD
jgi:hypothetical protein